MTYTHYELSRELEEVKERIEELEYALYALLNNPNPDIKDGVYIDE